MTLFHEHKTQQLQCCDKHWVRRNGTLKFLLRITVCMRLLGSSMNTDMAWHWYIHNTGCVKVGLFTDQFLIMPIVIIVPNTENQHYILSPVTLPHCFVL